MARAHRGISVSHLVIWVLLAACQRNNDPPPSSTALRRDSAGIEIITNDRPAWTPGEEWTIDSAPSLVVDDSSSGVFLQGFLRVATFRDGTIALTEMAPGGGPGVHLLDSVGHHLRIVAKTGEGPGEFRQAPDFGEGRDGSIVCYQTNLRQMAWLTAEGVALRHLNFFTRAPQGAGFDISLASLVSEIREDGAFISIVQPFRPFDDGLRQEIAESFVVRDSGSLAVPYGSFLIHEMWCKDGQCSGNSFLPERFFAIGPDPLPFTTTQYSHWQVDQYDTVGKLKRMVRLAVQRIATPTSTRPKESHFAVPDSLSPIQGLQFDADGRLWVSRRFVWPPKKEYPPNPSIPKQFDVIDTNGIWLGTVRVPEGLGRLKHIGPRLMAFSVHDSDDREAIRFHRIQKGASRP